MNCLLLELLKRNKDKEESIKSEFSNLGKLVSIKKGLEIAKKYFHVGIKFLFNGKNWHANSNFGIPIEKVNFDGLVGEPLSAGMALIYGSAIGAGGNILSGMMGGGDDRSPEDYLVYKQLPDYPESESGRELWGKTLQEWGGEGGYGSTDMNWDEIMSSAKDRLSRYYWGGVSDPGLAGKMKSQAARQNRPVNEQMLMSIGQQEALDIGDLTSDITTQKSQYQESARNTWLNSLMNLSSMKPSYITPSGTTGGSTYGKANMIGDVSSGVGSLFSQYAKNKQAEDLYSQFLNPGGSGMTTPATSQSSIANLSFSNPAELSGGMGWQDMLSKYGAGVN